MCNAYGLTHPITRINQRFAEVQMPLIFPTGAPNLQAQDRYRPTDPVPVVRLTAEGAEWAVLRWGFPPGRPTSGPVINFRSEGRAFTDGRCLMPASHFFEFTGVKPPKSQWKFTLPDEEPFAIAGFWRSTELGEAVTMLTIDPGSDVAPYHDRQIVPLTPRSWAAWLDPAVPASEVLKPGPAGSLKVVQVR